MKKPTIIFAVQLPPPIHGSSLMNELIVNDPSIEQRFNVIVLPIQMSSGMEDLGLFSLKKLFNTFKVFIHQTYLLSTHKIDLYYIAFSPLNFAFYKDFILVSIAKIFNKKILLHLHGQGIRDAAGSSLIKRKMYQHVFKNAQVICLAEPLFEDIKDVYKGKPHFLPNGIKVEKNLDSPKKKTDFLFLSNLMSEKGINIFLQALFNLHKKGIQFNAEIIGDSADFTISDAKDYIEKSGLSQKIKILGPIYGRNKYDHLAKAKILVLPSFKECFPLTILEAFQAKTAVIATNTGGIPELVKNGQNGYIVEPKDLSALEEKMEFLLKDETLQNKMGELNFIKFEENYTQAIFIAKFIKILESNLNKSTSE